MESKKTVNQVIHISHPDKILFPKSKITKQDLANYYQKIAPFFLPHAKNHLMVMHRFPEGIDHEGFYQKQISDYFPSWIQKHTIDLKKGTKQTLLLINSQQDLVYLANQDVITFHSWLSSVDHPHKPDKIVFDLDPATQDLQKLQLAAKALKKILKYHNLMPFIMTTGSRGYHIVVPIVPNHSFEAVHDFAKNIAQRVTTLYPDLLTTEITIKKRTNKIFIDYLRNSYGQTSVACYSVRALEHAPIATPIAWSELSKTPPQKYNIKNIFRRLSKKEDPWKNFTTHAKNLSL